MILGTLMLCADHISCAEADEAPTGSPTAGADCGQAGVKDCRCNHQDCIQCGTSRPCNQCTPTASSDRGLWKHCLRTEAHSQYCREEPGHVPACWSVFAYVCVCVGGCLPVRTLMPRASHIAIYPVGPQSACGVHLTEPGCNGTHADTCGSS